MTRILVIDNYDSFTYNLVQYLLELGSKVEVVRNDVVSLEVLLQRPVEGLVVSPGPGRPENSGVSLDSIRAFGERGTPVLGVCLGHQCIGQTFGGEIRSAKRLMHGKISEIKHDAKGLFFELPNPFEATRYHSLVISQETIPSVLEVCATSEDGEIMGVKHHDLPIAGVQFHPESVMTKCGKKILENFLIMCSEKS